MYRPLTCRGLRPEDEPVGLPHSLHGTRILAFQCSWHTSTRMQGLLQVLPVCVNMDRTKKVCTWWQFAQELQTNGRRIAFRKQNQISVLTREKSTEGSPSANKSKAQSRG